MNLDCSSTELLYGVQYLYWTAALLSAISVLIVPIARDWHRYGKLRAGNDAAANAFTVPKSWFLWFYVLGLTWVAILLMNGVSAIPIALGNLVCKEEEDKDSNLQSFTRIPLLTYGLHLSRRLWEEWHAPASKSRMHVLGFLLGASFYLFAPLALVFASSSTEKGALHFNMLSCALGAFLLYEGSVHQYICHGILRATATAAAGRRNGGEDGQHYTFPRGDWFRWSSNPHYCAEIIIYAGMYFILPRGGASYTFWLLALLFTTVNLCITGSKTHDWYLAKFGKAYQDEHRARVIPLVF